MNNDKECKFSKKREKRRTAVTRDREEEQSEINQERGKTEVYRINMSVFISA